MSSVSKARWVVDGIEAGVARIEQGDGTIVHLPASLLPRGAREGSVLAVEVEHVEAGAVRLMIRVDESAREDALARSRAQVAKGARRPNDPGGNVTL